MSGDFRETHAGVRAQWEQFIDGTSESRQELFQVALRLTGNPFDAEDLVHDVLLRAFGSVSVDFGRIQNQRAYLHRMLSNLWIDRIRRARFEVAEESEQAEESSAPDETLLAAEQIRSAAFAVFGRLPPRQRACLILQDVCGFTQKEIADMLSITVSAVKVAVHRARRRLHDQGQDRQGQDSQQKEDQSLMTDVKAMISPSLVDRFVAAMQSHDLDALKALVVDGLEAEVFPCGTGVGWEEHVNNGWIRGCFYHHIEWREQANNPVALDLEARVFAGEPIVLLFRGAENGDRALEEVWRLQEEDGLVARVRDYGFCPDLVTHVADHFELPCRPVGYRLTLEA